MSSRTLSVLALAALLGCGSTPSTGNDASTAQDVVTATDRGATRDTPAATDVPAATDAPPDPCVGLGEFCHDVDPGSGPLHDCHEGAHDSTPAWCAANAVRCRQLCAEARDASTRADASSDAAAHSHDAGPDGAHQH